MPYTYIPALSVIDPLDALKKQGWQRNPKGLWIDPKNPRRALDSRAAFHEMKRRLPPNHPYNTIKAYPIEE